MSTMSKRLKRGLIVWISILIPLSVIYCEEGALEVPEVVVYGEFNPELEPPQTKIDITGFLTYTVVPPTAYSYTLQLKDMLDRGVELPISPYIVQLSLEGGGFPLLMFSAVFGASTQRFYPFFFSVNGKQEKWAENISYKTFKGRWVCSWATGSASIGGWWNRQEINSSSGKDIYINGEAVVSYPVVNAHLYGAYKLGGQWEGKMYANFSTMLQDFSLTASTQVGYATKEFGELGVKLGRQWGYWIIQAGGEIVWNDSLYGLPYLACALNYGAFEIYTGYTPSVEFCLPSLCNDTLPVFSPDSVIVLSDKHRAVFGGRWGERMDIKLWAVHPRKLFYLEANPNAVVQRPITNQWYIGSTLSIKPVEGVVLNSKGYLYNTPSGEGVVSIDLNVNKDLNNITIRARGGYEWKVEYPGSPPFDRIPLDLEVRYRIEGGKYIYCRGQHLLTWIKEYEVIHNADAQASVSVGVLWHLP